MIAHRNEPFARLLLFISAVFGLGGIALAISRDELSAGARWGPAVTIVALALFCIFRLARAGVYTGPEGIRVVNPLRTVELPWHRVVQFTLRRHGGFPAVGFVLLDDGTEIQLWGVQARANTKASRRIPEQVVEELNERLRVERERTAQTRSSDLPSRSPS